MPKLPSARRATAGRAGDYVGALTYSLRTSFDKATLFTTAGSSGLTFLETTPSEPTEAQKDRKTMVHAGPTSWNGDTLSVPP
jgi:hypothetical protein